MTMDDDPYASLCKGADVGSAHLQTVDGHGYGDYEARLRPPDNVDGNTTEVSKRVGRCTYERTYTLQYRCW